MLSTDEVLERAAKDGSMSSEDWQLIFANVLARLDHIIYNEFPIPPIPVAHPPPILESHSDSYLALDGGPSPKHNSPKTHTGDKENAPPSSPPALNGSTSSSPPMVAAGHVQAPAGTLPPALLSSFTYIKRSLSTGFSTDAPFTIQRFAEMVLRPRQHYRYLHAYLNSLERIVSVVSGASLFPLPSSSASSGGSGLTNGNTTNNLCSDESLGGALLTPIPWLRNDNDGERSPKRVRLSISSLNGIDGDMETTAQSVEQALRQEGGVTQGELLRQEQEASDPPAPVASAANANHPAGTADPTKEEAQDGTGSVEDDEQPHARGPDMIGLSDTGFQEHEFGFGQVLDMEAAVGRPGQSMTSVEAGADPSENTNGVATMTEPSDHDTPTHSNGDIILTDADGLTEEERDKNGAGVDQTGPDAIDTTTR